MPRYDEGQHPPPDPSPPPFRYGDPTTPYATVRQAVQSFAAWRDRLHACKGDVPTELLPCYRRGLEELGRARGTLAGLEDALWAAEHPQSQEQVGANE